MIGEDFKEPDKDKNMPKTAVKEKVVERNVDLPPVVSTIGPATVLAAVLRQLGKPKNISKVSPSLTRATAVTQDTFRVNIYTDVNKGHFTANELTHSYFVRVDDNGRIVRSNPEIVKAYE